VYAQATSVSGYALGEAREAKNVADAAYNRANSAYNQANAAFNQVVNAYNLADNAICRFSESTIIMGGEANSSGAYSVVLGWRAISEGNGSVAIGQNARSNGYCGAAVGHGAFSYSYGTAVGYGTYSNSYGVAIGYKARSNRSENIAIGDIAAANGTVSVAVGYGAKANGDYSLAMGRLASSNGLYSTAVGYNACVYAANSTALGCNSYTSNSNSIQLGNASYLSTITARVPITVTSDERDKADITDIEDGAVRFLNKVRAIRYVLNHRELYICDDLSVEEREKKAKYGLCSYDKEAHAKGMKKGKRIRVGVSAQNTQKALEDIYGDSGYANLINDNFFDFDPDEIPEGVENQLSANYEGFIPFLIKAIQELDARIVLLEHAKERNTVI
ncbi:tail fiber domain-containing protein, partial [Lachnospiraceae bacterium 29-84]